MPLAKSVYEELGSHKNIPYRGYDVPQQFREVTVTGERSLVEWIELGKFGGRTANKLIGQKQGRGVAREGAEKAMRKYAESMKEREEVALEA